MCVTCGRLESLQVICPRGTHNRYVALLDSDLFAPCRAVVSAAAALDCLRSLSLVAQMPGYCRPSFVSEEGKDDSSNDGTGSGDYCMELIDARHPMLEALLMHGDGTGAGATGSGTGDVFVPNSVRLGRSTATNTGTGTGTGTGSGTGSGTGTGATGGAATAATSAVQAMCAAPLAIVVTGPNMGGKSSYVRMVATLAVMAQIGSFVPAVRARMLVHDAVFTRYGMLRACCQYAVWRGMPS